MTAEEFAAWSARMRRDAGRWTLDPIHNGRDRDTLIVYCSEPADPACGIYVSIMPARDGTYSLAAGRFCGAVPHIGEACFRPTATVPGFDTLGQAVLHAAYRGGMPFLLGVLDGRASHPMAETVGQYTRRITGAECR